MRDRTLPLVQREFVLQTPSKNRHGQRQQAKRKQESAIAFSSRIAGKLQACSPLPIPLRNLGIADLPATGLIHSPNTNLSDAFRSIRVGCDDYLLNPLCFGVSLQGVTRLFRRTFVLLSLLLLTLEVPG